MNFLAHLYLAGENEEIIVGNFIADHVKGNRINKYSDGIKTGIRLHREIDTFSDNHLIFRKSKKRLAGKYRKYAGVIVDMYYDHFLSANWDSFSEEDIKSFTNRMYKIVIKRFLILPAKTQRILPFMAASNWLVAYGTIDGLGRALKGIANRTPFESGMENAIEDIQKDYNLYKTEFEKFFPELIDFSRVRLQELY
ncbi:MAG: ACP phosphodiesterase [Bacteroidales bacterium]|nr:ACP phosphodiesterase [Bacteroidales bacterium]